MKLDAALESAIVEGYSDPAFWCRTFLPHWFPGKMPWLHLGIIAILTRKVDFLLKYPDLDKILKYFTYKLDPKDKNSPDIPIFRIVNGVLKMEISRFTLIMMPRGFSKTTLVNAVNLFLICYEETDFIFYLSETATHSQTQLENIKRELENNEKILAAFGNLKGDTWRNDFFRTTKGISLGCAGRGGQVRGKNVAATRPSRIILDDVEDKESVATKDQRDKTVDWFFSDVKPMLPRMKEDAQIIALGTLLSNDALLAKLCNDPSWTSIRFGALLPDGTALWPEMMSAEKIAYEKSEYQRQGMLNSFYLEYLSTARNTDEQKFPRRFFRYNPSPQKSMNAIALDPAISPDPDSDMAAIAVVGMQPNGKIIIHEVWGKVVTTPREMINVYFNLHRQYNCIKQGIESIGFQAALIHIMQEEMFRKGYYMGEITPITHKKQNKLRRVEAILHPRFANGYIEFLKVFPELEEQLEDWPNGLKDLPDAIAMALTLLDPFAAQAADPSKDLAEDTYEPLEKVLGLDYLEGMR